MKSKQNILTAIALAIALALLTEGCGSSRLTVKDDDGLAPKREFRGAWIQTVYQNEYKDMSPAQMSNDFVRKLNYLKACGVNAVIFQVRPEADAFYKSDIEPWSRFYTGTQGLAPEGDFDLMRFLIAECHKRNMEFHAWLNPYRAGAVGSKDFAASHVMHRHPERFVGYDNLTYFDPGLPQNRQFFCSVVEDIVARYDVDAIHMDDYFYPYPLPGLDFPDDKSFATYGLQAGYTADKRGDWRRNNVNRLIRETFETIRRTKPWVRLGISPFGIYRNRKSTPDGSGSLTNGLQCYDDLYTDIMLWIRKGWVDYMLPQIYWEIGHPAADYATLANWWNTHDMQAHLYIGQDVARTMKAGQLEPKMKYARQLTNVQGNCFWPANELLWNTSGVADSLRQKYHRYPALIPAYTNLHKGRPKDVRNLQALSAAEGIKIYWDAYSNPADPESARYFVVYCFPAKGATDKNNPANILEITSEQYVILPFDRLGDDGCRVVVTAVDRFHNETKKGVTLRIER
jgi:uncharacterized lipoprotein YddW (UPF0748 family)